MKRGEIYYVRSNYQEEGSEQRGGRPAVIVSNDKNNENSEVVEIVYMTTQPKKDLPTHVLIRSASYCSTALCEQVCSIGKHRIGELFGELTEEELKSLDAALAISLGLDFAAAPVVMREPTEEELEKLREDVKQELLATIEQPKAENIENPDKPQKPTEEKPKAAPDAQIIKTKTERDLYKKFSEELLEILKGGARP